MIDEKKLIEEIENIQVAIVGMRTGKSEFSEHIKRFKNHIIQIINNQPKISLENKTSDWIPVNVKEPSKYGVYLVSGHIHGKQNEHIRVADYFGEFEVANNFVVTAWQSLPPKYEG